jgi:hypothetical protein
MVKPDEVPEAWGLMEMTKGGLRVKKQAPARSDPSPIDRGFAASLLRSGEDLTQSDIDQRVADGVEAGRAAITEREKMRNDKELTRIKTRTDALERWKKTFEDEYGCRPNFHSLPSDMIARISLATEIERGRFDALAIQAKNLAALIEEIQPKGPKQ